MSNNDKTLLTADNWHPDNWSTDKWDPEEYRELALADLDNIAGGREMRPSERKQFDELSKRVAVQIDSYVEGGMSRQAKALYKDSYYALQRYQKDIASAPEDGPDIPVGRYFSW